MTKYAHEGLPHHLPVQVSTRSQQGRLRLSLRPVTSTVRTNPACLSPSTLSRNLQSLGPDCDSGAQFAPQNPVMASVKLEDCSQTLELNVNIKEEEEEKIRTTVSHGRLRLSLRPVTSTVSTNPACLSPSTLSRNLQSLGPDCDSGAQFAPQDPEMASVKLEDCSQTLELNVNIKDEEEQEKIRTTVSHGRLELRLRPVTSIVRTNPACLSHSTLSPNLHSLGPDCDSGAQFALQDPEMASVKLEDCSQTLELNVNIKDEEVEEKIGKSVNHGRLELSLRPVTSTVRTSPACLSPSTLSPNLHSLGPDCDSGAQFALQDPEMASVKLEDCSQTLELNVNIKDEEEEEKIGKSVNHGRLELSPMPRPVTSIVRTNPACLSHSTLCPNLQSLGPDCDSGAQFALQDSEMASVKLEDCSQTLELNVIIKDEEEEEKIGTSVNHGRLELSLLTSVKLEDCSQTLELNVDIKDEEEEEKIGKSVSHVRTNPACLSPSTLSRNLQSLGPDCDSGAQFALQDPEMASVKLEDCSQTLELNVIIKDEEEEEKIGKSVSHGRLELSLRPVTSTVRTNPACLSPSTRSPNLQSLGPDCDSGAQFALQDPEMASVKLEDCSQTLELNVNIKDEEEEEKIGKSVSHGRLELSLRPVTSTVRRNPACLSPSTLSPNLQSLGPDCDSGAQFAMQNPEMASVKLEDCSQTLELNVNIKDEEEEEKIVKSVSHGLELSLRPVTSTVRTNPACLSHSTLSPNLQSLSPDCDSGAQFALQDSEMKPVKLEDCSQTLELNVNIKDEEEKIGKSLSHGDHVETFSTSREQQQEDHRAKWSHHCPHYAQLD
ncbi:uncharacterized protein ACWYII_032650 isoform 1-T1 [Salvelinus alpinus]